jgi:starvation-inducible outer membrane lipoprotein
MKWLFCLTISLILAGCAAQEEKPPEIQYVPVYVYPDCGPRPERTPVEYRDVSKWQIIEVDGVKLWTITTAVYNDMGYNAAVTKGAVKELKAEIKYYVDCLERQKELENGNQ